MQQVLNPRKPPTPRAQRYLNAPQRARSKSSLEWDAKAPPRTKHAPDRTIDAKLHAKFWKYDTRLRDYLPIERPCDYCDKLCHEAFLCDDCADYEVARWEYTEDTQATDILVFTALTLRST